jgi:hypothetical protein
MCLITEVPVMAEGMTVEGPTASRSISHQV